jgi:hypothetical protein
MKTVLLDFFIKMAIGFGVGAGGDAVVEITRAPVLNDTGSFGNPHMSNYEYMSYLLGTFGVVAGVADLGMRGGQGIFGFTRSAMPFFAGFAFGTYFYEHTIANLIGIRNIDPYDIASRVLPPILPAGSPHLSGETFGGPSHPLPGYA